MVSTVAVLSDVHGVLPVLDAVLAEPDVRSADLVVVTGDHAAGPQPTAVLDRFLELGERVLLVRGNADRELAAIAREGPGAARDAYPVDTWAAGQLGDEHVALLAGLPHPVTVDVDGFGPVVFCHGTPRDDEEVVLVDTRLARWAEVLADLPDRVRTVVCGHTHMPFVRLVDRRLVVNPGSIGMPYGRPGGAWALLRDGQVALRHTPVDVPAAVEAVVDGSSYPDARGWAEGYLTARLSDADAMAAFGPRDGRTGAHQHGRGTPASSGHGAGRVDRALTRVRPLVLYKRWRLRPGVTTDDVAALVREQVVPAYRRLSTDVTLELEEAADGGSVIAVQRWSSEQSHDAAVSGDGYGRWWAAYEPSLAAWDRLVELVEEWSARVVDLDEDGAGE